MSKLPFRLSFNRLYSLTPTITSTTSTARTTIAMKVKNTPKTAEYGSWVGGHQGMGVGSHDEGVGAGPMEHVSVDCGHVPQRVRSLGPRHPASGRQEE